MTDDLVQRLRRTYRKEFPVTGSMIADNSNRLRPVPILAAEVPFNPDGREAADRIEQLEREKAVVSDLWEQQKEIALDYLTDCNKAADRIEAQAAEIERLRVEAKAQFDRGYYDGRTRAALEARGLEIREKG